MLQEAHGAVEDFVIPKVFCYNSYILCDDIHMRVQKIVVLLPMNEVWQTNNHK